MLEPAAGIGVGIKLRHINVTARVNTCSSVYVCVYVCLYLCVYVYCDDKYVLYDIQFKREIRKLEGE